MAKIMSSMNDRSRMSRTTSALGVLTLGLMLAYVAYLIGGDAEYGVVFRIFAASPLLLGSILCMLTAIREMRGEDKSSPPRWASRTSSARDRS
jgi:hypothetical protein